MTRAGKPRKEKGKTISSNGANVGLEAKLWLSADKLRNHMDAADRSEMTRAPNV